MIDRSQWLPLSPAFTAAIRDYDRASRARLLARDARDAVTAPLYHYTDAGGLKGILTNQQVWFTHWQHLNDPTEMQFGMDVAKAVLAEVGTRLGPKIKIFCDMVDDLFSSENMRSTFELYVASFSRARDDLNQWRVYAAKGQGFALSLASSLFGIEDKRDRRPHEHVFVAPVTYGPAAGRLLHLTPVERAAQIVAQTVKRKVRAMSDINRGMPFFDEMGKILIGSELLLNCLAMKDSQHAPEQEFVSSLSARSRNSHPEFQRACAAMRRCRSSKATCRFKSRAASLKSSSGRPRHPTPRISRAHCSRRFTVTRAASSADRRYLATPFRAPAGAMSCVTMQSLTDRTVSTRYGR